MSATVTEEPKPERAQRRAPERSQAPADVFMRKLLRIPEEKPAGSLMGARTALQTGIVISGIRCLFTYLVFPLLAPSLGVFGAFEGPVSVALGLLAVVFSIRSMRRFWGANHRHRWTYTAFAAVIIAYVVIDLSVRAVLALT